MNVETANKGGALGVREKAEEYEKQWIEASGNKKKSILKELVSYLSATLPEDSYLDYEKSLQSGDHQSIHRCIGLLPEVQIDNEEQLVVKSKEDELIEVKSEEDEILGEFFGQYSTCVTSKNIIEYIATNHGYQKETGILVQTFLLRRFVAGAWPDCKTIQIDPLVEHIYNDVFQIKQRKQYDAVKVAADQILSALNAVNKLVKKNLIEEDVGQGLQFCLKTCRNKQIAVVTEAITDSLFEDLKKLDLTPIEKLELLIECLQKFAADSKYQFNGQRFQQMQLSEQTEEALRSLGIDQELSVIQRLEEALKIGQRQGEAVIEVLMSFLDDDQKFQLKEITYLDRFGNKKTGAEYFKTLRKDKRKNKAKRPELKYLSLIELCNNLAEGRFVAKRETNRINLYHLAAMLEICDLREISILFTQYYQDDILRYVLDPSYSEEETNSKYESQPVSDGINHKNFAEVILIYFLVNRPELNPGQKLDVAHKTIKRCIKLAKEEEEKKIIDAVKATNNLSGAEKLLLEKRIRQELIDQRDITPENPLLTWKREENVTEVLLHCSDETELIKSIVYGVKKTEKIWRVKPFPVLTNCSKDPLKKEDRMRTLECRLEKMEVSFRDGLNSRFGVQEASKNQINYWSSIWSYADNEIRAYAEKYAYDSKLKLVFNKIYNRFSRKPEFYLAGEVDAMLVLLHYLLEVAKGVGDLTMDLLIEKLPEKEDNIKSITSGIALLQDLGLPIRQTEQNYRLLPHTKKNQNGKTFLDELYTCASFKQRDGVRNILMAMQKRLIDFSKTETTAGLVKILQVLSKGKEEGNTISRKSLEMQLGWVSEDRSVHEAILGLNKLGFTISVFANGNYRLQRTMTEENNLARQLLYDADRNDIIAFSAHCKYIAEQIDVEKNAEQVSLAINLLIIIANHFYSDQAVTKESFRKYLDEKPDLLERATNLSSEVNVTRAIKGLQKLGFRIIKEGQYYRLDLSKPHKADVQNVIDLSLNNSEHFYYCFYQLHDSSISVKDYSRTVLIAFFTVNYIMSMQKGSFEEIKSNFISKINEELVACRFFPFNDNSLIDRYILLVLYFHWKKACA